MSSRMYIIGTRILSKFRLMVKETIIMKKHEFHMPEMNISVVKFPEKKIKSNYIVRMLCDYGVGTARDAIRIIEEQGVDKFNFDYPYGSFEEYKKHVLAGEFDVDIRSVIGTPSQEARFKKAIEEGKIWTNH